MHNVYIFRQAFPSYELNEVKKGVTWILDRVGLSRTIQQYSARGPRVLLKPNLISQPRTEKIPWEALVTNPSVIRAAYDYLLPHLNGKGEITIADSPQTDSDFNSIIEKLELKEFIRGNGTTGTPKGKIIDLRKEYWKTDDEIIRERVDLPGDPEGYTLFDLGRLSEFSECDLNENYYGADYFSKNTNHYHTGGRHQYLISNTVLHSDLVINLPKLKTHKKAGVTICLKNLVGINGDKNYLPHFTMGTPREKGDEFAESNIKNKLQSRGIRAFKNYLGIKGGIGNQMDRQIKKLGRMFFGDTQSVIRSGNWYGNDTVWRMILDLNKILLYGEPNGTLLGKKRKIVCLVDGIIGGEGNGPMSPEAKECGVILGGTNPVAVDLACSRLMGFDYRKIPHIIKAFDMKNLPLVDFYPDEIQVVSNVPEWDGKSIMEISSDDTFRFKPHFGWKNHLELKP